MLFEGPVRKADSEPVLKSGEPMPERWILLLLRLSQAILVAWVGSEISIPALERELPVKGSIVSLVCVILVGKAVYDTLFYPRYRP